MYFHSQKSIENVVWKMAAISLTLNMLRFCLRNVGSFVKCNGVSNCLLHIAPFTKTILSNRSSMNLTLCERYNCPSLLISFFGLGSKMYVGTISYHFAVIPDFAFKSVLLESEMLLKQNTMKRRSSAFARRIVATEGIRQHHRSNIW